LTPSPPHFWDTLPAKGKKIDVKHAFFVEGTGKHASFSSGEGKISSIWSACGSTPASAGARPD
jgi:hypothetical protein